MRASQAGGIPATLADALVAFFGIWSIYGGCNVYLGRSFTQLLQGLWLPAIAFGFLLYAMRRPRRIAEELPPSPHDAPVPWGLSIATLLAAGAGLIGWHVAGLPYWTAWLLAMVHLAVLFSSTYRVGLRTGLRGEVLANGRDLALIALVGGCAVVVTLGINRPDADDAYYFNVIISALDHPNLAVLSFDGMHGDPTAPIQQYANRPQTYELFLAAIAALTGLEAALLYYVLFPSLFAGSFALAQWLVVKRIAPNIAWIGIALVFLVLLCWGEDHQAFGNFAFVRLFQGKGVFICVFIPLIVHNALRFSGAPSPMNWTLLALAQCAAASFTSSGLLIAPLAAALTLLSGTQPSRRGLAVLIAGGATSIPPLLTLLLVRAESQQAGPILSQGAVMGIEAALGGSWRAPMALFALLCLPLATLCAGLPSAGWTPRYVGLAFLLILNGISGPLLAELLARLFSWRIFWAIPIPLLTATAFAIGIAPALEPCSWRRWRAERALPLLLALISAIGLAIFLGAGQWTHAERNGTGFQWAQPKRPQDEFAVAQRIVEMAPRGSTVLAPSPISSLLTGFHDGPRLVFVRSSYLANLSRHWGETEYRKRESLARFADGLLPPRMTPGALRLMDERCVNVFATFSRVGRRPDIDEGLRQRGFQEYDARGYVIWLREMSLDSCAAAPHQGTPQGAD